MISNLHTLLNTKAQIKSGIKVIIGKVMEDITLEKYRVSVKEEGKISIGEKRKEIIMKKREVMWIVVSVG